MKTLSPELMAHLQGDVLTICYLWKATRADGKVYGFTDHDADIVFDGVTYTAATGFTPSSVQTTAALSVDNLEVTGFLNDQSITEIDLNAGLWDFCKIEVMLVNWDDLTMGSMSIKDGTTGNISLKRQQYVAEFRGLSQSYTKSIGDVYSPSCRADLGDAQCTVNMTPFTFTGSVGSVDASNSIITATALGQINDYFQDGKLTFTSGLNSGLSMEVKTSSEIGGSGYLYSFLGVGSPLPNTRSISIFDPYLVSEYPGGQDTTTVGVSTGPAPWQPTVPAGSASALDPLMAFFGAGIPTEGQLLATYSYNSADTHTYTAAYNATFLHTPFGTPWAGYDSYIAQLQALFVAIGQDFWAHCTSLLIAAGIYSGSNQVGIIPLIPEFNFVDTGPTGTSGNGMRDLFNDSLGVRISAYWVPEALVERAPAVATGGTATLQLPMPFPIVAGDTFVITSGCDKALGTCIAKYNNVLNFRGEPYLPGQDQVLQVGGR